MPQTPLHAQVRALVDAFVHDITELVRAAAFEALDEALRGTGSPAPIRARPRREPARSMVEVIMTPLPAGQVSPARSEPAPSSLPRTRPAFDEPRPEVDIEQLGESIVTLLEKRPGLRAEELARLLGAETADVKPALAALKAKGRVVASGKARGTRYLIAAAPPDAELVSHERKDSHSDPQPVDFV